MTLSSLQSLSVATRSVRIFLVLTLVLITGCATYRSLHPAGHVGSVAITFERQVTRYGEQNAEFSIRNGTAASIWFTGYRLKNPIYYVEHWAGHRWIEQEMGWFCGTGLARRELPPDKRITFHVLIKGADLQKPMRVGVWLSDARDSERESQQIHWSERVLPRSPPPDMARRGTRSTNDCAPVMTLDRSRI